MIFKLKKEVQFDIQPEIAVILGYILAEWQLAGLGEFTVTSAKDSHTTGLHPVGQAVDIRTRHMYDVQRGHQPKVIAFVAEMKMKLRLLGVDLILHPEDMTGPPHLHCEYDPKVGRLLWERE